MKIHRDVPPGRRARLLLSIGAIATWLLSCGHALAQQEAASTTGSVASAAAPDAVTAPLIDGRRKEAQQSKDLDDAARTQVLDFYKQAAEAVASADALVAKVAESKRLGGRARQAANKAKDDQAHLRETSQASAAAEQRPETRSLAVLEGDVVAARTELSALLKQKAELEKEPNHRANRRKEIHALLLAAPDNIRDLKRQLAAAAPKDEPPLVTLARRTALQARLQRSQQEAPALQAELERFDAEEAAGLIRLRLDLAVQKVALQEQRVKVLTARLDHLRRTEAEHAVEEARRLQLEAHPMLRSYAADNFRLAEEARSLTKPIEIAEHDLKQAESLLDKLMDQAIKTHQKAEDVGLTGPIGQLLRMQRTALPDPADFQRSVDANSQKIDEVQFRMYELDELRSTIANPEPIIQKILAQAPGSLGKEEREALEMAARGVLQRQQQSLDALTRNFSNYFETLLDLVNKQRKSIDVITRYAAYIDERVLWIRSSRPLGAAELVSGRPIAWLVLPAHWKEVLDVLAADTRSNPLAPVGFVVLIGTYWYVRKRFGREIAKSGHDAHRSSFTRFLPTLRAFGLTLIASMSGAGLLCYPAWRLAASAYGADFPGAVSDGLFAAAWLYLPLEVVRRTCRRDGLAESHFAWSPDAVRTIGRDVRWLMAIGLPITFVTEMLHSSDPDTLRNALERFLFALGMALIAVFHYRLLRPQSGIVRQIVTQGADEWVDRLQRAWRWGGVSVASVIAILVIAGYEYTALQFVWRLYLTGVALLLSYYIRALFLRWILIHRRLMGMQQAKERRVTELRSTVAPDGSVPVAVHAEPAPKADLALLSAQTRTLVNVAILTTLFVSWWRIWVDVFPSMGILNHWVLWTTTVGDSVESITFASLLVAGFIIALTWIAVRNIPGLLEMTILERLPLDTAGRFAFSTLARYTIVVIGLVSASSSLGIGWAKVQWLATALTFGLAFGLQEIFANFIAGLIILFERPVRVGDMVTIDDVTGVVSRIRIRATTILNGDRKEFIVPNKEFITGRTLNWTLTDTINRIVINVGIAYGSDTELARELLLKAAMNHPAVLRDPVPTASFEEFGEHSLKLVLRCFLPNLAERTAVIHELHTAINRGFAEHGIEIAVQEASKPTLPLVTPPRPPAPHLIRTG